MQQKGERKKSRVDIFGVVYCVNSWQFVFLLSSAFFLVNWLKKPYDIFLRFLSNVDPLYRILCEEGHTKNFIQCRQK